MKKARQNFDDVAWDRNDEAWDESQKRHRLKPFCRQVESLAEKIFEKQASRVPPIFFGGFNVLYRIRLEGEASDVIVHLPCPDLVQFPEEKTRYEAGIMAYLAQNTTVPVPTLFYHTSSSNLGPVMILEHVKSTRDMSDALAIPNQDPEETPVLNAEIDEYTLSRLYKSMAVLLMQLFKPNFDKIGSLVEVDGRHLVAGRPITQNMNNMVQLANIPRSVLPSPDKVYESADQWYTALSAMHMAQLVF
ncbi:hypothetical protein IL306_000617 [Fusarium sp. DS 682]|nr:hypothetical protein IL306_000617 [Fusarium sp. DS 682]